MGLLGRLRQRRLQPEWMDQPGLDPQQHRDALRGLERINRLSGSARILWPQLARLARRLAPRPCRVLDVATGAGDVPRRLWRKANRARLSLVLEGCDISSVALDYGRGAKPQAAQVRFFEADALSEELPSGFDAVVCSLFLHHLTEEQAVGLLRRMGDAADSLVLVNDLVRSRAGYLLAWLGTRLLTRSPVVHVDGPRSVEGAFTLDEVRRLADAAGLTGAAVERRWPCRYLLSWTQPESAAARSEERHE